MITLPFNFSNRNVIYNIPITGISCNYLLLKRNYNNLEDSTFKKLRSWHQSHHFMASRWRNNGNSEILYLRGGGAPKSLQMAPAAMKLKDACSLEEAMSNLHSILKSIDITLPTQVHLVKAMVFLVVIYGGESWTIKKAGCWRIDAFELWCWRRLLRVLWTARRSNQSILKEISPECSLND